MLLCIIWGCCSFASSSILFCVTATLSANMCRVLKETQLPGSDWGCCCALSLPSRGFCPTSRPSRTSGVWTRSGYSWWSGGSCSFWASRGASERSGKTRFYSSLYVPWLRRPLCTLQWGRSGKFTVLEMTWVLCNSVLLLQFSVFLGIIFFLELTTGVLAFVFKDWIKDQLNLFINNNIRAYRDDIDLQNLIDFTQEYVSSRQTAAGQ